MVIHFHMTNFSRQETYI